MATTSPPSQTKPPPQTDTPFTVPPQPPAPGAYPPSPHGQTHVTTDLVPIVTTSAPGLTPQLSANPNTWLNGNGVYTTPPGTPLNMKGTVATFSALPSTGNALNDFWVTSDTGHGWAWNGTAWTDMGPFQGPPGAAGPAGGAGPAGPAGPSGQGYTWMGVWNSATAYQPYQNVSYQGASYVCISANTNQLPTNTTYWNIIAQMGATGATGPAGTTGAPGTPGGAGPQGQPGQPAYSLTTAQVTIPAVGSTTTVTLSSVSWANVGDYVSVQGAAGSGQSAVLQITAINTGTNTLTLLNPPQGGGIPPASNIQPGLMNTLSGNVSDYVGGDNACHNLAAAGIAPPGAVMSYAGSTAPTGWLICDGSAVSRTTYAALYGVISTTYGAGDGSTTFNLPDARGRAAIGAGQGASLTNRILGSNGGEENHLLSTPEMPAHAHVQNPHTHTIWGYLPLGGSGATITALGSASGAGNVTSASTTPTEQNAGGGGTHNNMSPFIAFNIIIKT